MKIAARQAQVERPLQAGAVAPQVLEQLAVERLDLGAVLLGVDAGDSAQAGRSEVGVLAQVLHERHPELRACDENVAERRREHPVRHQARFQIGEARLEPFAGARHALGGRRRAPERAHDAVDLAIASELAATGRAGVDVVLDAAHGSGLGVSRRRCDEVGFDLQTGSGFTAHRGCSMFVGLVSGGSA